MHPICVIPARWASSRLPGKPLRDLGGRPLVVRVLEIAEGCDGFEAVLVATDDQRILEAVREAGGEAVMTSPGHASGTDRVAEVLESTEEGRGCDWVVNLQGDEPFLAPRVLDSLLEAAREHPDEVGTLCEPIRGAEEWRDPSVVKVARDHGGRALYFSRAPIPSWLPGTEPEEPWRGAWRHVGVYSCSRAKLLEWARAPRSPLEAREGLEQLRLMEGGTRIRLVECPTPTLGVDTEEHLEEARRRWERERAAASTPRKG